LWNGTTRGSAVSAILLDIDHFKRFNDAHGHIEGDACIRTISRCIRDTVDEASFVFRFGGEEILVLSVGREPLQILAMAERIRKAIEGLGIRHRGLDSQCVTVSLGAASGMPVDTPLERLLQDADSALYQAKNAGRNAVSISNRLEPIARQA